MQIIARALLLVLALCAGLASPVKAQGTVNIALQQQFSFVGCNVGGSTACGAPMLGCLLYIYQVGTVATAQLAYQDTGLTQPLQWPVPCDGNARLPMFYLANGNVHVRLTDAQGVVQFDYPSMLVIGPSSGGGGGGGIDPTTLASTGDVKWRPTTETLAGWVKINGQTIGNATSGATGRANADTQALYVYLWSVCPNASCPVATGRGASGLADFNASKAMTLPDMRGRAPWGLDDMGASTASRLTGALFILGNSITPLSVGGEAAHTLLLAELAAHDHGGLTGQENSSHTHATTGTAAYGGSNSVNENLTGGSVPVPTPTVNLQTLSTGIESATHTHNISSAGGNSPHNTMAPFMLGTWHYKL